MEQTPPSLSSTNIDNKRNRFSSSSEESSSSGMDSTELTNIGLSASTIERKEGEGETHLTIPSEKKLKLSSSSSSATLIHPYNNTATLISGNSSIISSNTEPMYSSDPNFSSSCTTTVTKSLTSPRSGFLSINDTTTYPTTEVGSQLFNDLVIDSTVFVDKSLFLIEYLIRTKRYALVTYPRRWGKSMNLHMLKTFVEIEVDHNGNEIHPRENDKFFTGGKILRKMGKSKLLPPLEISHHAAIVEEYMGKYPVIYLNMQNIFSPSYDGIIDRFRLVMKQVYSQHKYLLNSRALDADALLTFTNYKNGVYTKETELQDAIYNLSEFLYLHHNKKVFILIDEYDAVINQAFVELDNDLTISIVRLIGRIFQTTLKGNDFVERSLITGVYRIAKSALFSELNNFVEIGVSDKQYAPFYGFTEMEVSKLLSVYSITDTFSVDIKEWYNGYNIGKYQIYNPWSIVNVLSSYENEKTSTTDEVEVKRQILKSYHEVPQTISYLDKLFKFPELRATLSNLVLGHSWKIELSTSISIDEYKLIKKVLIDGITEEITDSLRDSLFSFLFAAGYLTLCPVNKPIDLSSARYLRIPNKEIRALISRKILNYYTVTYKISNELFLNATVTLQNLLLKQNPVEYLPDFTKELTRQLNSLFAAFPEFNKLHNEGIVSRNTSSTSNNSSIHGNEALLQMVIGYIAIQVTTTNKFGLEVNLGTGRTDVVFVDSANKKAVIIELKYNNNTSIEAIQQIKNKEYTMELRKKYPVIILGINLQPTKLVDITAEVVEFQP